MGVPPIMAVRLCNGHRHYSRRRMSLIPSMPIRQKAILLHLGVLANALGVAVAYVQYGQTVASWFAPVLILSPFTLLFLRCPRCGEGIYTKRIKVSGADWRLAVWRFAPKRCGNCGRSFTTTEDVVLLRA